jgi:tripartite-type tricarboxylate transporter receptor subunit TctC
MLKQRFSWILAGALAAAGSAQAFPDRPITIVVPFGAGTAVDVNGRDFAQSLAPVIKQNVLIDNRAGAEGTIGANAVLNAQPDGHTLMFTSSSIPVLDPVMKKNRQFDVLKDFTPICTIGRTSNVMNITGSNPMKTAADVIAEAKAYPGKVTFAYSSATTRLAGELFAQAAGIKLTGVSYKASSGGLTDVASGVVDLFFIDHVSASPLYGAGKIRPIAVAGDKRVKSLPEVPDAVEIRVPGYNIQPWFAVYAPAKTPPAVVKQLRETVAQALKTPLAAAAMERRGLEPLLLCGDDMDKFQRAEIELWRKVTKQAGIEPE